MIQCLDAVENVFLGQMPSRWGVAGRRQMCARFRELCDMMEVEIEPDVLARRLPVAKQQVLEIMRGLQVNSRILLLDEPTASLGVAEREALYKVVEKLRQRGITILYVSHNLDEVLRLCDTITVLRNGRKIASKPKGDWSKSALVRAMLGSEAAETLDDLQKHDHDEVKTGLRECLRAEGVRVPGVIDSVDLTIGAGEILGIGGLVGSGRTELLRALAGLDPSSKGRLWIDGKSVPWPRRPREAIRRGIVLAPEDRKGEGLVLSLTAADNINMSDFSNVARGPIIDGSRELRHAGDTGERFGFDRNNIKTLCRRLSGGNQQKVLLAKAFNCIPKVLLVDEPTRGIDVGAKGEVLATLRDLAAGGTAVVLVSSELEEVAAASDRILVLSKGRFVKELLGRKVTVANILHEIFEVEQ